VPQIEVTFDIDANGIVNVSAKDRGTGKTQAITITASSGLAKDEVERMVKRRRGPRRGRQAQKEEIEAKNQRDTLIYSTEKSSTRTATSSGPTWWPTREGLADARQAVEAGGAEGSRRPPPT
jgi:molecular chaperone DnaK